MKFYYFVVVDINTQSQSVKNNKHAPKHLQSKR